MVTFSFSNIAHLFIVWAFYLGLGLPVGISSIPLILLIVGTILYLVSFSPRKVVVA